ncbi:diacylglycerol kinase family protein [Pedobacter sp. MC2016-24]|uniref:diacylglycerol kinase family protein n=1 Tax=Pedobacter sp. MC2016-24 TaxID=2780090 RepID=UPI0018812E0F|nr:diacylglycerol kinase family protein [Pedobacter sp. MC2016-24]MBE9599088.1 diacylglycerol kinase family protein [Pedobacter sp. MC2016-24]
MQKFLRGFGYAFAGIGYVLKTQLNFKVHCLAMAFVILLGWYFKLSTQEWLWIAMVCGFVLASELFNTGIEVLVDLVSPEIHPKAKIIKDVSAAAVLIAAVTAIVVGLLIFMPKIIAYAS